MSQEIRKLKGSAFTFGESCQFGCFTSAWNLPWLLAPSGRFVASDSVYRLSQLDEEGLRLCLWDSETGTREGMPWGAARRRPPRSGLPGKAGQVQVLESEVARPSRASIPRLSAPSRSPRAQTCPLAPVFSLLACDSVRTGGFLGRPPVPPSSPLSLGPTAESIRPYTGRISEPQLLMHSEFSLCEIAWLCAPGFCGLWA